MEKILGVPSCPGSKIFSFSGSSADIWERVMANPRNDVANWDKVHESCEKPEQPPWGWNPGNGTGISQLHGKAQGGRRRKDEGNGKALLDGDWKAKALMAGPEK